MIEQLSLQLSLTQGDIYILMIAIVVWGVFLVLGMETIYQVWFGLVVGLAIFITTQVLLSGQYTADAMPVLGEIWSRIIIGSSMYLIFILALLVPLNRSIVPTASATQASRIIKMLFMASMLILFIGALLIAATEGRSVFTTDNFFRLFKGTNWYTTYIAPSHIGLFLLAHAHTLIVMATGYMLFLLLFEDIVWTLILSLWYNIRMSRIARAGGNSGGHDDHGGHDEHGHEEGSHDDHGGHDEHGHGAGHGHGHH